MRTGQIKCSIGGWRPLPGLIVYKSIIWFSAWQLFGPSFGRLFLGFRSNFLTA